MSRILWGIYVVASVLLAFTEGCSFGQPSSLKIGDDVYVCLVLAKVSWGSELSAVVSPSILPSSSGDSTGQPTSLNGTFNGTLTSTPPSIMPLSASTPTSPSTAQSPTLRGTYRRVSSVFTTDSLSRFAIRDSWTSPVYSLDSALVALNISDTNESASGFAVSIESNGIMSYQKMYREAKAYNGTFLYGVTFPLLMAIIQVDKGTVTVCM
jgi:hypothetical protein